jgi:hypothetical protein
MEYEASEWNCIFLVVRSAVSVEVPPDSKHSSSHRRLKAWFANSCSTPSNRSPLNWQDHCIDQPYKNRQAFLPRIVSQHATSNLQQVSGNCTVS